MTWFMWGLTGLIFLGILISLCFVRIEISYRHKGEVDAVAVNISTLHGLVRIKREIPSLHAYLERSKDDWEDGQSATMESRREKRRRPNLSKMQQWQFWKPRIKDLFLVLKAFLANIRCERLAWATMIGTGEAADTGTLVGVIWTLKTTVFGWGTHYIRMKGIPELQVTPDFQHPHFETDFHCILKFRIGDAILAGIRIFFHIIRRRKRKWQNTLFKA